MTALDGCSYFVLIMSTEQPRRFPPPWTAEGTQHGFTVRDANGVALAHVYARDDLVAARWGNFLEHLTSDEARRIACTIARLPELLNKNPAFKERGPVIQYRKHWRPSHPYHVALEDFFVRERWDDIEACCRFNDVPFDPSGEVFENDGKRWRVYHFMRQFEAIRFWDKFAGRWMLGDQFVYPERPKHLIAMKSLSAKGAL